MWPLLLVACASASPLVDETTSEGGSWSLALETATYDVGAAEVTVHTTARAPDVPVDALTLYARADMDEMAHDLPVVPFDPLGDGAYRAAFTFDMAGLWTLSGYVVDTSRTEGFTFVVEVLP